MLVHVLSRVRFTISEIDINCTLFASLSVYSLDLRISGFKVRKDLRKRPKLNLERIKPFIQKRITTCSNDSHL